MAKLALMMPEFQAGPHRTDLAEADAVIDAYTGGYDDGLGGRDADYKKLVGSKLQYTYRRGWNAGQDERWAQQRD